MTGSVGLVKTVFVFQKFQIFWRMFGSGTGAGVRPQDFFDFFVQRGYKSHQGPELNINALGHPISLYWLHKLWADKSQVKGS